MKKNFFIIIFFVFLSVLLSSKAVPYRSDPKQFIAEVVDEAKKILVATNSQKFKEEKLSEIALKAADINGIGYYTLGKYRKGMSDEELEEYSALFEKYFLKSFTSRLTDYSDPKIEVIGVDVLSPKYTCLLYTSDAADE